MFWFLVVAGAIVPYTALVIFVTSNGLSIPLLLEQALGTPGAAFFTLDVIVGAVAVIVAVFVKERSPGVRGAVTASALVIGPACALPLWLALSRRSPGAESPTPGPSAVATG